MYTTCASCGATIPGDKELCPFCGKPVAQAPKPDEEKINWDYCGILSVNSLKKKTIWGQAEYEFGFQARGMGKFGGFTIAETGKYTLVDKYTFNPPDPMGKNEAEHHAAREKLDDLIKTLLNDGWERMTQTGSNPWDIKFRRKAKSA